MAARSSGVVKSTHMLLFMYVRSTGVSKIFPRSAYAAYSRAGNMIVLRRGE